MKNLPISPQKSIQFIILGIFSIMLIFSCATDKQLSRAAQFRFYMNEEAYRIRSVSSVDNGNSYNELIGKKFVATDYDKDRVLDKITLGEAELAQVQLIYEYGLNILFAKDKVETYTMNFIDYVQTNSEYDYQIKSFQPKGAEAFNEFKIIKKYEITDREIVFIDYQADGTLDEILKGTVDDVNDFQARYSYVIVSGLEKQKLVRKDNMILVRAE